MKHFALIGEKLRHSLSVPIHQAIWRELGVTADYQLIEIPKALLSERVPQLLEELDGFNVTIPYKQTVMPYLHQLSRRAAAAGAVNTVICAEHLGDNTDIAGFAAMLRAAQIEPAGQSCYILGTGGAARAAEAALTELGAANVTCVSRHPTGHSISYERLEACFSGILINCTPAGMMYFADACPLSPAQMATILPRASAVADVVYQPRRTPLLEAAAAAGLPVTDGLVMLVAQAIEAEAEWLHFKPDPAFTNRILKIMEKELA